MVIGDAPEGKAMLIPSVLQGAKSEQSKGKGVSYKVRI